MLFILPETHTNRGSRERKFDLRIKLGTQKETATEILRGINTAENRTQQFEHLLFGCVVILRRRVVTAFFFKKNAMKCFKFGFLPMAGSALKGDFHEKCAPNDGLLLTT